MTVGGAIVEICVYAMRGTVEIRSAQMRRGGARRCVSVVISVGASCGFSVGLLTVYCTCHFRSGQRCIAEWHT